MILLDLKMSKLDGLEVLRIIKEDESLKHIPVVVMTSSREGQDVFRSYQLGVNAYVVKPLDFHQFTEAMRAVGAFWILAERTTSPSASQRRQQPCLSRSERFTYRIWKTARVTPC